jgi:pimeloyl-ACP methyl ester carboxylesterase
MTITETSRSEFITLRGLRTHVRQWGAWRAQAVHAAWLDGRGGSFQFLVDAFQRDWHVIAMDWRGFGETDHPTRYPGTASYWFPDYVADLEADRPLPARRTGGSGGAQHGRQCGVHLRWRASGACGAWWTWRVRNDAHAPSRRRAAWRAGSTSYATRPS